jgi:hypothetical protein
MKQDKKNKSNRTVSWPTSTYFTFNQLHKLNPSFTKRITLRVRLANSIIEGIVAEIGSIPGGQGRPPKVYVLTPVTQIALDKAEQDGISVPGEAKKLVNVVSVGSKTSKPTLASYITSVI